MIKLSILICHLNERKPLLDRLMAVLQPQIDAANGEVEALVEADDGQLSTGAKRNILLERAQGILVAHVDDDDKTSDDYCARIIGALDSNPDIDCVGIEGLLWRDTWSKKFIHSLQFSDWFETPLYWARTPNHLNPIRRELALQAKFPRITSGEDREFSKRILPLLKSEVHIEKILYHYYP